MRLVWQALDPPAGSYTVFVHLLDAAGQIVAQQDRQPHVGGRPYPPDLWVPGEVVADDPYMLSLPAELPGGPYRLRIGWYVPETGDILPVGGDAFAVLPIQIEGDTP
ncbi:MAG: hypothetical protein GYB64_15360 [Chloroflexi bacterium]|nr:hypothetical protein [Chloroflexota bacterium]